MTIHPDFSRRKERVWIPLLADAGLTDIRLAPESLDHHEATDLLGDFDGKTWRFAIRTRNPAAYDADTVVRYMGEVTIRFSRPSGEPTEWTKLFDAHKWPEFFCYGWIDNENRKLREWLIIDVSKLRDIGAKAIEGQSKRHTNTDTKASSFLSIPLHAIAAAIARRSPNHPGSWQ